MTITKEECLRAQQEKIHMYSDRNCKKDYYFSIVDIKDDRVKINLKVCDLDKNTVELDVNADVIEDNYYNLIYDLTSKDNLKKRAEIHIINTLDYILNLINKGITNEYFVKEKYNEFSPRYSLFSINHKNIINLE
jgi:hypothetical protein